VDIKLSDLEPTSAGDPSSGMRVRPSWRRRPIGHDVGVRKSPKRLFEDLNTYFEKEYDSGQHPTLCDMAGAAGFESVTQMVNHARRHGKEVMYGIGRGLLAVAAGYEEQAQEGGRHAVTILGLIPEFDSEEPASQAPQRPFSPQRDINLNITGVHRPADQGAQLTDQEAYLQLIKHKTYEEVAPMLEAEQTEDGDYAVIDLETLGDDEPTT
jgi:hypothetical protein